MAMESLGATKKRRADKKENVNKEPKRRRSTGSETVAILREKKIEKDTNARAADNELRKAQLELDTRRHNDMMQVLQQQQQQQQMQAFSMPFQQQREQQQHRTELFLKLFERLDKQ